MPWKLSRLGFQFQSADVLLRSWPGFGTIYRFNPTFLGKFQNPQQLLMTIAVDAIIREKHYKSWVTKDVHKSDSRTGVRILAVSLLTLGRSSSEFHYLARAWHFSSSHHFIIFHCLQLAWAEKRSGSKTK